MTVCNIVLNRDGQADYESFNQIRRYASLSPEDPVHFASQHESLPPSLGDMPPADPGDLVGSWQCNIKVDCNTLAETLIRRLQFFRDSRVFAAQQILTTVVGPDHQGANDDSGSVGQS